MKWTRMAISEAASEDMVKEIVTKMREHVAAGLPDIAGHSILVEEGGLMVVLITDWRNRQHCLTYHASKACRQLVASTQHMLVGNYVVKLFQNRTDDE